jgi:hypothetical protein
VVVVVGIRTGAQQRGSGLGWEWKWEHEMYVCAYAA